MADFSMKAYDRLPSLMAVLSDKNGPVNLTGATVMFIMRPEGGGAVKVNTAATIVDATQGIVRYDWATGDTTTPGVYEGEFEVISSSKTRTFPTVSYIEIEIFADLDGSA